MNYYPFHLGDYASHTAHLEPMEDLAYRRMLDAYYLREAPLPCEPAEVARLIRMKNHVADVESVLVEFFQQTTDGWRHERCDAEIARMQERQEKARASAEASVNARRAKAARTHDDGIANAERTLNERSTDAERTLNEGSATNTNTNTNISSSNELEKTPRSRAAPAPATPCPDDVDAQVWDDWLALRKKKRAPVTATVVNGARAEAGKAGLPLTDFLRIWCVRGSQGLQAEWLRPEERRQAQQSFYERDQQAKRARFEELTGRSYSGARDGNVIDITPLEIAK